MAPRATFPGIVKSGRTHSGALWRHGPRPRSLNSMDCPSGDIVVSCATIPNRSRTAAPACRAT
jgi:hypothetical protein